MQQGATIYETNSSPTHFYCAENGSADFLGG